VATAGGAAAGATATTIGGDQAFLDYARCMRANGASDFPDPVQRPGHTGLSLEVNPSAPQYHAADQVCHHFIAAIIEQKSQHVRDSMTPQLLAGLTAYARCMRDRGIPLADPDPTDGHISFDASLPFGQAIGRHAPVFQQADAACRSQLPAGVTDDGTGPP
jgi:hypothetical protein